MLVFDHRLGMICVITQILGGMLVFDHRFKGDLCDYTDFFELGITDLKVIYVITQIFSGYLMMVKLPDNRLQLLCRLMI